MLKIFMGIALLGLGVPAVAAADEWKEWAPLVGEWEADNPSPGNGGSFTLEPALDGKVLVRKNHAQYTKAPPHDDLMIIYREGAATRADYWDNEGHAIHYVVTTTETTWVFQADAEPKFRLTYTLTSPKTMKLQFDVGGKPYITATVHKKH